MIFKTIYPDIWVAKVWFLKKKEKGDGFEDFHCDYNSSNGGINPVSSTIKVNLGACHSEDEEEKEEKEGGTRMRRMRTMRMAKWKIATKR